MVDFCFLMKYRPQDYEKPGKREEKSVWVTDVSGNIGSTQVVEVMPVVSIIRESISSNSNILLNLLLQRLCMLETCSNKNLAIQDISERVVSESTDNIEIEISAHPSILINFGPSSRITLKRYTLKIQLRPQ